MSEFFPITKTPEASPFTGSLEWDVTHDPLLAELGIPETLLQASLRQEEMMRQMDALHHGANQLFEGASPEDVQRAQNEVLDAGNDPELLLKLFRDNPARKSLLLARVGLHGDRDGMAMLYEVGDIFLSEFGSEEGVSLNDMPRDIYLNSDPGLSPPTCVYLTCERIAREALIDINGNTFGMGIRFYGQLDLMQFEQEDLEVRDRILAEEAHIWRPSNGVKRFLRHALDERDPIIFPGGGHLYVYRKTPKRQKQ